MNVPSAPWRTTTLPAGGFSSGHDSFSLISSHAVPTSGCPAKGSSTAGVKIRSSPARLIVDEDGLAEAELCRHRLTPVLRDLGSFEKDAELIAPFPLDRAKDTQDVKIGHQLGVFWSTGSASEHRQEVLDLKRSDLDAIVVPLLALDLHEAPEGVLAEGSQDQF